MRPLPHVGGVTRLRGGVEIVQTANVENQIKRVRKGTGLEHVGAAEFDLDMSRVGFGARLLNGARHKINANGFKAVLREINRVGASAAAEVQRAPRRKFFALDELHNFGRRDVCIPRHVAPEIAPLKIESLHEEWRMNNGQ